MTPQDLRDMALVLEGQAAHLRAAADEIERPRFKLVPEEISSVPPPKKENLFTLVLRQLCVLWEGAHGMPYRASGGDRSQLGRLLNSKTGLPTTEIPRLGEYFRLYLEDRDPHIVRAAHPLTLFCSSINVYRARAVRAPAEATELRPLGPSDDAGTAQPRR